MRRTKIQIYPEFNKGFVLRLLISTVGIFGLLYLLAWATQVKPHETKPKGGLGQARAATSRPSEH